MNIFYSFIILFATICGIVTKPFSQPLDSDFTCLILNGNSAEWNERKINRQRIKLQDLIAFLESKNHKITGRCNTYNFEKVLITVLPTVINKNKNDDGLITAMTLHKILIESFSKSIRKVISDPQCKREIQDKEKDVRTYLGTYLSSTVVKEISDKQKQLNESACSFSLNNIIQINPPAPDTYTQYGRNECIKTCKMQLLTILNELSVLFNLLQVSFQNPGSADRKVMLDFYNSRIGIVEPETKSRVYTYKKVVL